MCGILGGNNFRWDYKKGIACLRHRGPDGVKVKSLKDFTLAFVRLAIIDLSENGMQPMFSDDGHVGIVFNGEIYGYQKLRMDLEKRGYRFRSTSDTEVILNAYLEWGERFVTKLDGMFGIAIYDEQERAVKLFRDRIGIKPLYYFYNGQDFAFSSELKGITTLCNNINFEVDNTAVYDYLNYLYIPEPKTYYKNVYKLLPGHRLTFNIDQKKIVKNSAYWKLEVNPYRGKQRKQEDVIDELRYLMKESIEKQMVADVPVGTFLSGGVDSSIVTYESVKINPQIESFSIGFDETRFDESKYALWIADKLRVSANMQMFRKDILNDNYNRIKVWYDEPFGDSSAFPTYLVSKLAKEKVTVALTGDGGDEIFGGYPRYEVIRQGLFGKSLPECLMLRANKITCKIPYVMKTMYSRIRDTYAVSLGNRDVSWRKQLGVSMDYDKYWVIRKHYHADLPPITRGQYLDVKTYLPGDILTKVDRAAMAVSLETRVPFLDKKIVEFAFSLSEEDRCPNGELKGLLKRAYEKELGEKFLNRKKQGFSIPHRYFDKKMTQQEELLLKGWKNI